MNEWPTINAVILKDDGMTGQHDHSLKLNKKRVRLHVAKFSFSNKVVNEWNILQDEDIILGCSLAGFKWKLDRRLRDKRGYIYIYIYTHTHISAVGSRFNSRRGPGKARPST